MSTEAVSPLRQRMIEDMVIRQFGEHTKHDHIRQIREFTAFLGCAPDRAEPEDLRRYQLHLASLGAGYSRMNLASTAPGRPDMSLRDRLKSTTQNSPESDPYRRFGVVANPFPPASQTAGHPHNLSPADDEIANRIENFIKEHRSQVVVIEGSQGVGKTNFLNHWEIEIKDALGEIDGYYVIRYLADPEASLTAPCAGYFRSWASISSKNLARRWPPTRTRSTKHAIPKCAPRCDAWPKSRATGPGRCCSWTGCSASAF